MGVRRGTRSILNCAAFARASLPRLAILNPMLRWQFRGRVGRGWESLCLEDQGDGSLAVKFANWRESPVCLCVLDVEMKSFSFQRVRHEGIYAITLFLLKAVRQIQASVSPSLFES